MGTLGQFVCLVGYQLLQSIGSHRLHSMNMATKIINKNGLSTRSVEVVSSRRSQSLLALLAMVSMVLASPIHLLLAHGHHDHLSVESTGASHAPVSGCQHHEHCSAHTAVHTVVHTVVPDHPEDQGGSDPCEDHSGDCDTCMMLASITPFHVGFDLAVSDRSFLEFTDVIQESVFLGWNGSCITSRGPPARI